MPGFLFTKVNQYFILRNMQDDKILIVYKSKGSCKRYYPANALACRLMEFISPTGCYKTFTKKQIELGLQLGMNIEVKIESEEKKSKQDEINDIN